MNSHAFLAQAIVFLGAAVIAVPLAHRLGLGSVIGYLTAGIVIGPFGLRLIAGGEDLMHFAEFGVVLLLFLIGLELNPRKLWQMRRPIVGAGGAQVVLSSLALAGAALLAGSGFSVALVAAWGLSLSSTAIALQILKEKKWLAMPAGQNAFSVLLFQDIAVIPMLAVLPLLAGTGGDSGGAPWVSIAKSAAAVLVIVAGGRYLIRPIFRLIARTHLRELFTAFSLFLVLGIAWLMASVGLSMALGSFLAGVLLAESEYRHELEIDIEPFKGLLLGLFFISVGMSVDFGVFGARFIAVMGTVLALLAVKFAVGYGVGFFFGLGRQDRGIFALTLAQGGEFAFVLFGVAGTLGIFTAETTAFLTLVVALSMLATPLLVVLYDRYCIPFLENQRRPPDFDPIENERAAVIIAGYGRFGQMVGRVLHSLGVPITVLDSDPNQIELMRTFGWKTFYGDASRIDLLHAAGLESARALVLAIDDMEASLRVIEAVKVAYPQVKILARARNRPYAYQMMAQGVRVVREVAASSIEMASVVLEDLGFSRTEARRLSERFYEYDHALLLESAPHAHDREALISIGRRSREELARIMRSDENVYRKDGAGLEP